MADTSSINQLMNAADLYHIIWEARMNIAQNIHLVACLTCEKVDELCMEGIEVDHKNMPQSNWVGWHVKNSKYLPKSCW